MIVTYMCISSFTDTGQDETLVNRDDISIYKAELIQKELFSARWN